MSTTKQMNPRQPGETRLAEHEITGLDRAQPRNMTFAQNSILTIKLLGGLGLLGGALWAIELWMSG